MFDEFLKLYAKEQVNELTQFAYQENLPLEDVFLRFEQHYIEDFQASQVVPSHFTPGVPPPKASPAKKGGKRSDYLSGNK